MASSANRFDIKLVNNDVWWAKTTARPGEVVPRGLNETTPPSGIKVAG